MLKKHIYDGYLRIGYSFDVASKMLDLVSPIDEKKEKELLKEEYIKLKNKDLTKDKIVEKLLAKGFRYKDIVNIKEK